MSSHHFVKEGQEPALFILDPISFEVASPLLEWAPLVLVSESALDDVLQWGIKIDAVLTVVDREEVTAERVSEQAPIEIICRRPEEDQIRNALDYLIYRKQTGVNILTTTPEAVFSHAEIVMKKLNVCIMDARLRWLGISTGRFEKWMVLNSSISIRKSVESQSMVFRGLAEKDGRFASTTEGLINIQSDGLFWVAETHT